MAHRSSLSHGHAQALALSQRAEQMTKNDNVPSFVPFASPIDSIEKWLECEDLFVSCLRTGDDRAAFLCLERLTHRFGPTNEKVMAFRGLYQEAMAENDSSLRKILVEYEGIIADDPTNFPIAKRRISLLRALGQIAEAIEALTEFLDVSPTDVEAWSELADLYFSQSLFAQSIFCLEEILLIVPNAWTIHARLGDALIQVARTKGDGTTDLTNALFRYCRSTELCEGYLRGFYGIKLASARLISSLSSHSAKDVSVKETGAPSLSLFVIEKLNDQATKVLARLVRAGDCQANEAEAAQRLLDGS